MCLEAPVAWPIAVLLDRILGVSHGTSYKRKELATLVGLHGGKSHGSRISGIILG